MKIGRSLKNIVLGVALATVPLNFIRCNYNSHQNECFVRTAEHIIPEDSLQNVLDEEMYKLGLDRLEINLEIKDSIPEKGHRTDRVLGRVSMIYYVDLNIDVSGEIYNIELKRGDGCTRETIRHELSHIANGDITGGRPEETNLEYVKKPSEQRAERYARGE